MAAVDVVSKFSTGSEGHRYPSSEPVRKSVRVRATPAQAFEVFTGQIDTWWPASFHIGSNSMPAVLQKTTFSDD